MCNRPKSAIAAAADRSGDASSSDLLTADEVIDRLLEDANLRRVAATCVLPAVRVGSDWRFRRGDLDEWIRQAVSPPAD
jgi:excisionase family DNA binding protein